MRRHSRVPAPEGRGWRIAGTFLWVGLLAGASWSDNPALLDAVKKGDVAAVRSLLESGADANTAQGDGLSVLHLAAQQGSVEIAKLLIGRGANLEAKTRIGGYTPLHLASMSAQEAEIGRASCRERV